MKSPLPLLLPFLALGAFAAEEPLVPAPITRAMLFKNGYALITRSVAAAPDQPFVLDGTIAPVHGTLWFEPASGFEVTTVEREKVEPNLAPFADLTSTYLGKTVTVELTESSPMRTVKGIVVDLAPPRPEPTLPVTPQPYYYPPPRPAEPGRYLTLKLENGELLTLNANLIASIRTPQVNGSVTQLRRRLRLAPRRKPEGGLKLNYLTRGLTWAPSYRLTLGPEGSMQLDLATVVVNELEDLNGVETELVSGFPNLLCLNVPSPLAPGVALNNYLNPPQPQPGMGGEYARSGYSNLLFHDGRIAAVSSLKAAEPFAQLTAAASGDSEDAFVMPGGNLTLPAKSSAYLPLATARGSYERLVEWRIPDLRNGYGRVELDRYYGNQPPPDPNGVLFDAVRFVNPLSTPLTGAPAEVVDGGLLLGQSAIEWTNPGQRTLVRISLAPTVTGRLEETDVTEGRATVELGNRTYLKQRIDAVLTVKNYRQQPVKLVVKYDFSGELVKAELGPQLSSVRRASWSVNPRRQLEWELQLQPGEEKVLRASYSVLIYN